MFKIILSTTVALLWSLSSSAELLRVEMLAKQEWSGPDFCTSYVHACPETVRFMLVVDTSKHQDLELSSRPSGYVQRFHAHEISITSLLLQADDRVLLDDPVGLALSAGGDNPGASDSGACFCWFGGNNGAGVSFRGSYDSSGWPMLSELGSDPVATLLLALGTGPGDAGFSGDWGSLRQVWGNVAVTAVPGPPAFWLLGTALGALGWMGGKRVKP